MCEIRVDGLDTCVVLSVYDTKRDFPYKVVNYSHTDSNIPLSIAYSAYTGQLTRFYRLCIWLEKFLTHATELTHTLLAKNGCGYARLNTLFRKFIQREHFLPQIMRREDPSLNHWNQVRANTLPLISFIFRHTTIIFQKE